MAATEETIPTASSASSASSASAASNAVGEPAVEDAASTARTLTLDEFVREQEELERAAAEAFADDEDGTCTYGDGSCPRSTPRQDSDCR